MRTQALAAGSTRLIVVLALSLLLGACGTSTKEVEQWVA